jgi:hypothetical protein
MPAQPLPSLLPAVRQVLRLIRSLPDAKQRAAALGEARAALRARAAESDPAKVLEYRKELHAKLGYLRIVAPRAPGSVASGSDSGTATYVFRDGEFVEGRGESHGSRCGCVAVAVVHRRRRRRRRRRHCPPCPLSPAGCRAPPRPERSCGLAPAGWRTARSAWTRR